MSRYDAYLASLEPAGWWKLADAVGSSTALDSSGSGYTGTVHGGVTFGQTGPLAGPPETAALFDGTTGHVVSALKPAGVFSAVVWFRVSSSSLGVLLDTGAVTVSGGFYLLLNGNGANQLQAAVYASANQVNLSNASITNGAWHMAAMSYDEATLSLYLDGALGASASFAVTVSSPVGAVLGSSAYPNDYFPGDIAEVAIFPTALSAAQIARQWAPIGFTSDGGGFPK